MINSTVTAIRHVCDLLIVKSLPFPNSSENGVIAYEYTIIAP